MSVVVSNDKEWVIFNRAVEFLYVILPVVQYAQDGAVIIGWCFWLEADVLKADGAVFFLVECRDSCYLVLKVQYLSTKQ